MYRFLFSVRKQKQKKHLKLINGLAYDRGFCLFVFTSWWLAGSFDQNVHFMPKRLPEKQDTQLSRE